MVWSVPSGCAAIGRERFPTTAQGLPTLVREEEEEISPCSIPIPQRRAHGPGLWLRAAVSSQGQFAFVFSPSLLPWSQEIRPPRRRALPFPPPGSHLAAEGRCLWAALCRGTGRWFSREPRAAEPLPEQPVPTENSPDGIFSRGLAGISYPPCLPSPSISWQASDAPELPSLSQASPVTAVAWCGCHSSAAALVAVQGQNPPPLNSPSSCTAPS